MKSFFVNLGKLALCGAVVAMIGCTDLHSDIKLVQSNSDKAAAELQEDITQLQEDLAAIEKELNEKYALVSAVDELKEKIKGLEDVMATDAELKEKVDALQDAIDALNECGCGDLSGLLSDLSHKVDSLGQAGHLTKDEIDAIIGINLDTLKEYIDSVKDNVEGSVIDQVNEILANYAKVVDLANYAKVEDLANYAKVEDLAAYVKLEDLKNAGYLTNEDIADLISAVTDANGELINVATELADLRGAVTDANGELINVATELGKISAEIGSVKTQVLTDVANLYATKEALATLSDALEKLSGELSGKLDVTDFEAYKTEVDAKLAELETMKEKLAALGKELEDKYSELKAADEADKKALREEIEAKSNELNQHLTQVLNVLQDQVNDLAARVQSLVFIPEYSDGKATIEWGLLIDNDSAVNFLYNTVISYNTLDTFKTYAKKFINKVRGSRYYAYIVRQMKYVLNEMEDAVFGPLDDINAQLDAIFKEIEDLENNLQIDTPDAKEIEEAFNELFEGIEDLVSIYVADQLSKVPSLDVDPSTLDPEKITKDIIADLKEAFTFGEVDVNIDLPGFQLPDYKTIVKNLIKKYVKYFKAEGISKVKDIVNKLDDGNISASDIIDGLRLVEFKELLSDLLPVAKKLEAMILENTAILKKESVIRYKVMGQNAEAVAADIATNWKKVLYYDVEAVDVRAAAPALEITKVVAKGDEIHVTVLPQNFNYRFYLTYILEDSFLYGAAESFFDKFGKTGLISYSAALVLNDGNNIRSTEYVNFVSGENPEIFTPEVVNDANQVVETKKVVLSYDTESYEFCSDLHMAYLSVPKRVACTKADLEKQGYSGIVERKEVVYNKTTDLAGPCKFNGFVGTFYDYYPHTFETLWSVNDITLVVKYDVSFE